MPDKPKKTRSPFRRLTSTPLYRKLHILARKVTLPGFRKIPIYDVVVFFFNGIRRSSLMSRANSLSFTFTLAIFPGILFLFTLIP